MHFKPFITGLKGTELSKEEISFIKDHTPWGIILFKRNCESPDQVRKLTDHIRTLYGREEIPILIDQEGGSVQRLKEPHWRSYPSASYFNHFYDDTPEKTLQLIRLNASLQAAELKQIGVNVNCAPLLDLKQDYSHDIITDRSFSHHIPSMIAYGKAVIQGLMDQSVLPVIKHLPGHGRARADSHLELPVITDDLQTLQSDFAPFKALKDAPLGMTAHILFSQLDAQQPSTLSPETIKHIIRGIIGFTGLLMSDDISMKALQGDLTTLSKDILNAGCDLVLHCNGDFNEMQQVAEAIESCCPMLSYRTEHIWNDLFQKSSPRADDDLYEEYQELLASLLSGRALKMTGS